MQKPISGEYGEHYHNYIQNMAGDNILENLALSHKNLMELLEPLSENILNYRYAPGKWSIKEILGHLIDTERVFAYRAMCIARGETTSLPGFDENEYAKNSNASKRKKEDLIEELKILRLGSILLFKSFTEEMLVSIGTANQNKISVRAIGYMIAGHETHHLQVIKERYL